MLGAWGCERMTMKYSGWTKQQMIGELVLRGVVLSAEEARELTKEELIKWLKGTEKRKNG